MKPIELEKHKGNFFKVLSETDKSQIAVMTIEPGSDSGPEDIHPGDQIVYVIEGEAEIELEIKKVELKKGMVFTIPSGAKHHIYNRGTEDLFILCIYTPPAY